MNLNLDKINISALFVMMLFALLFSLSSCEQPEPQGFLDVPEECEDLATVQAWVFLTYVAEVHPKPGLPSGYTAVIKIPFEVKQIVPFTFKETDDQILGRLKSPWPGDFLIGQVKSYEITRKYCKGTPEQPQDKPFPKKPDPKR
jgi:hypothetical protein